MCWIYTAQKQTGNCRNGRREKKREVWKRLLFFCIFILLADFCVSVSDVAWEGVDSECLARGVAPGAVELTTYVKSAIRASSERGQAAAAIKHESHIRHCTGIKGR